MNVGYVRLRSGGLLRFLLPTLPALRYFATPENRWEELLQPLIPKWLVPTDTTAIRWFYDGGPRVPWESWLSPILAWSLIALLLWSVMLALATLLRKQWIDHERMTFIQVQLPMALIEAPEPGRALNRFLSDRVMWIGFLVPVVLYGLTGLSNYYPGSPQFSIIYPNFYSKAVSFEARPWNAVGGIYFAFFPSALGFGFLLTTEVSMSTWVFFILTRLEAVALSGMGLELKSVASGYGSKQFGAYQDMGGYLALIAVTLFIARGHLRNAFQLAMSRDSGAEARAYRLAIFGGAAAVVALLVILNMAGIATLVALGFLVAYFIVCTSMSWLTSNTGILQLPVVFRPEDYLFSVFGTRAFRPADLAGLAIPSRAFTFYYNEMQMPHYLNNYKLARETGLSSGSLVRGMGLAVVLGLVVAWLAQMTLLYQKGAYQLQNMSYIDWPRTPFRVAATYISQPQGPDPASFIFMAIGAAAFAGMTALRGRFMWWPLHPAGMLLGSSLQEMWFSLFLAWLCKVLVLRYGGARVYQRARPFFLGMVAGEAAIACFWIAAGFMTGKGVRLLP